MTENAQPSPGEVRALANQLLTWADRLAERAWRAQDPTDSSDDELVVAMAVSAREISRCRNQVFAPADLGNPAWDVILDLYVQESQGFRVSLDHLALSGELRAETVYACVDALEAAGLVERAPDRFDRRTTWLSLTENGKRRMAEFMLQSAHLVSPRIPADGEAEAA